MVWYVYILETQDSRLYTGATNDVDRRMSQHKDGKASRFTRAFKYKALRYVEKHPDKSSALRRERQIQAMTRTQKLALIHSR